MKIMTVIGARPQFIKASVISRAIQERQLSGCNIQEVIVHTGQHFDHNMSQSFFDELSIPVPKFNLQISGGSHGSMTGKMLIALDDCIFSEKPDLMLVYGDTNSTLAAALSASKLHIPVAHVEAGLRSFNRTMPEEINRVMTDHLSNYLFCPTQQSLQNLTLEGITKNVYLTGDVMFDSFQYMAVQHSNTHILEHIGVCSEDYILATCHRAETTDDVHTLTALLHAFNDISTMMPVVLPLHPRTRAKIAEFQLTPLLQNIYVINPVSYAQMVTLLSHCNAVITDSGGLQKEAYFAHKPCVTVRSETEWVETLTSGFNQLASCSSSDILPKLFTKTRKLDWQPYYGLGDAGKKILDILLQDSNQISAL